MGTSVASVTGGIAGLFLSALALCFNEPRMIRPEARMPASSTQHVDMPHDKSGNSGFHATVTIEEIGKGKRRLTLRLEFGRPAERDENEAL